MTGRHRGGRSLRRRLVVAVLAAAVGRGYVGRHRLVEAALGRALGSPAGETVVAAAGGPAAPQVPVAPDAPVAGDVATALRPAAGCAPQADAAPAPVPERATASGGRTSVAPWLRVVPSPPQPDQLPDTLPHPVVTLFPLAPAVSTTSEAAGSAESADTAEERVFAEIDAERERSATKDLAAGADVRPYRPRHTA